MKKINVFFLFVLFTMVIFLNASAVFAGTVTLSWDAPTTNVDGTPLTDLAGYEVHYGTASGNYSQHINVGNVTTYTVNNLTDGTYYFAATVYDTSGNESTYSNEVSKTVQSTQQYTLSVNKGGTGSGTVTSFPAGINCGADCSEAYNAGTVVTLTASPNTGSTFTGWSGGGCTGTGTCSFSLNTNTTVTASFANENNTPITYTITTRKGRGGSVSPSGRIKVNNGTDKTFTIVPKYGYNISDVEIDDVSIGKIDTYTFRNVTKNHQIDARFGRIVHNRR